MADFGSLQSPTDKHKKPTSPFFSSPRLFTSFTSKGFSDSESIMSPTSILDSKPFSAFKNSFWSESSIPKTPEIEPKRHWEKLDSKGVGLGLVDALKDEKSDPKFSKPESRIVIFGSQLKIQVPPLFPSVLTPSESQSPKSPADFGLKTRNSQQGSFSAVSSLSPAKKSGFGSANSSLDIPNSPRVFTGCLSTSEMELSEDYTCVISHGPNPKTTHIFDDCIVESCCGVVGFSGSKRENGVLADRLIYPSEDFLSFCYACKKNLEHGKDIFMYRGEKAFCSRECRYKEMLLEEGMEKLDSDGAYGTCSL